MEEAPLHAIETTGTVDEESQLHLDRPLPISGPARVRVIVIYPPDDAEIAESEWLRAASGNPAFEDLAEPEEDVYTLADGRPFHDEE